MPLPVKCDDTQTRGEEIANSISHGAGFVAALVGLPFLVIEAMRHGDPAVIVGASIFGAAAVLLYFASTMYHALPVCQAKRFFRLLDHMAIFLLIAGTYTPFTLGVLRGAWGWTLLGLVWSMAVAGVILKTQFGVRYRRLSTLFYLAMGWLIVVAIVPLWQSMPGWGLFWLACGGLAYTVGVIFYAMDRVPYFHFVWHLFVVVGTACHFVAVLYFAA